jgi:hypothetical protein
MNWREHSLKIFVIFWPGSSMLFAFQKTAQSDQTMDRVDQMTPENLPNLGQTIPSPTQDAVSDSDQKCSFRSCKVKGAVQLVCAASNCNKRVHLMCSQALVLMKHDLEALLGGRAVCTKKCYEKVMKDTSGGIDEDGARTGQWDSDGKLGPDDPHTSAKILLDWWMTEGNYSKFCGKNNGGVKKIQFSNILAEKMTAETTSQRTGKNVLSKIQHIEKRWREAHAFATSETGAGIMEKDGETNFRDIVERKCPYYYDLLEVMQDRASAQPKVTSYNLDGGDEDADDDDSVVSELSANTKKTSASRKSTTSKKRKGPSLIDESTVRVLTEGNKTMEQRMFEIERHNKVIEEMELKRFRLEEKREERESLKLNLEQDKFKSMAWQGKNDELNYKMNLISKYQEFKDRHGWSDAKIVRFCPEMIQVIAAQQGSEENNENEFP